MRMSDSKSKLPSQIKGACGEHYVASYLSGHGLIVAMPRAGVPGCDLFVATTKIGQPIRLQVKTGTQSMVAPKEEDEYYLWDTSYAVIDRDDSNLWYAYVWLKEWPREDHLPEVFFIPSKVVVKCMKERRRRKKTRP